MKMARERASLTYAIAAELETPASFLYYKVTYYKVTPAMAAGVTDRLWEVADIVKVLEAWE